MPERNVISEEQLQAALSKSTPRYLRKYGDIFEALSASPVAKHRGISPYDQVYLGKSFDQVSEYLSVLHEDGGLGDLGPLPTVAIDIVATQFGTSVLPYMASMQNLEDEQGNVYFKETIAAAAKGAVSKGDVFSSPLQMGVDPSGYASEMTSIKFADTVAATTAYSLAALNTHVRPNTILITLSNNSNVWGKDTGEGYIAGPGLYGTVNYETGAMTVDLQAAPAAGGQINVEYGIDFGEGEPVPSIQRVLRGKRVQAKVFALAQKASVFQNFAYRKRFGKASEDELIADVAEHLNAEIASSMIAAQSRAVPSGAQLTWKRTATTTSQVDHYASLAIALAEAEAVILQASGGGTASYFIVDPMAATVMASLAMFEPVDILVGSYGPHLYGYYQGKPVIRATYLSAWTILMGYKGSSAFDAAAVFGSYMPLFVTGSIPTTSEVVEKGLAACMGSVDVVNSRYLAKVTITA